MVSDQTHQRPPYRERLLPGVVPSLIIWALIAVFAVAVGAALGALVGWVCFAGATVIVSAFVITSSPVVVVDARGLTVGRARLPWAAIGDVDSLDRDEARMARGMTADARAYLVLRTLAAATAVRVNVTDPKDPHPHWLVSTRHPDRLRSALQYPALQ